MPDCSKFENPFVVVVHSAAGGVGLEVPEWNDTNYVVQAGWGADVLMESYSGEYFQPSMDLMNAGGLLRRMALLRTTEMARALGFHFYHWFSSIYAAP